MANRVCFLVDGFNVYHSVCEALRTRKGASMTWLDMQGLCASYLSSIGNGAILEKVFYFSAFMDWIPDKVARHQTYVDGSKRIWALFPFGRHNAELKLISHGYLKMKATRYLAHQLPNPVKSPSGGVIWKPATW